MNHPIMKDVALMGQSPSGPIRLGIVVPSTPVAGWVHYTIAKLISCRTIDPVLVVLNREAGEAAMHAGCGPILLRLWMRLDRWLRRYKTDALQRRDWRTLLNDSAVKLAFLEESQGRSYFSRHRGSSLSHDLDLFISLADGQANREIISAARIETWSVQEQRVGEEMAIPGEFWDIYERNAITQYGPQLVRQKGNCTELVHRSSVITSPLSLALNQNAAYWELAEVLVKRLSDPDRLREELESLPDAEVTCPRPNSHRLTNVGTARFILQWLFEIMCHELRKRLYREEWSIVLQVRSDCIRENHTPPSRIIRPPEDHFYADPFLIERNGRNYLFFEDYRFSCGKGMISCYEIDSEGNCSNPHVVLERDYHLSYPFLFTWKGQIYMIPETRENRTIEMYRAKDFPDVWILETVLMSDVAAVDSTLLFHNNKWWLFTAGMREHACPNYPLWLFFSDSPLGPWTPHPKNPVVSDPTRARPAGALFFDKGNLIRPGQDSSTAYGRAIHLQRVSILSETEYEESPSESINPDQVHGSTGIHTFNQSANLRVMDCKFSIPRIKLPVPFTRLRAGEVGVKVGGSFSWQAAKDSR